MFREELESFASSGALSRLQVCFSRDEPDQDASTTEPCRYVQHKLLLHSKDVVDILLKQNGRLYVCG